MHNITLHEGILYRMGVQTDDEIGTTTNRMITSIAWGHLTELQGAVDGEGVAGSLPVAKHKQHLSHHM